jgi:hypothetical protein
MYSACPLPIKKPVGFLSDEISCNYGMLTNVVVDISAESLGKLKVLI